MSDPKFVLSKKKLMGQVTILKELGLHICYSYKTNRMVGDILQDISDVDFSIHAKEELDMLKDPSRIWFFTQAENEEEIKRILKKGVKNFVVDNEIDLHTLLAVLQKEKIKINLSLRMKSQEHRVGSGKYFVYGMSSKKTNEIISKIKENEFLDKIGIHVHRKSQNTSEWEIKSELEDSLSKETIERINFINLGGGLPIRYRSYNLEILNYIFSKLKDVKDWLKKKNIDTYIEPGRFLAGPCIDLVVEIIQIQDKNIIINVTIYNCALDTLLTGTKMLVEGELEEGEDYLIKGNSPTRDDIFRYKVKLPKNKVKVGEKIKFINAGAYNYTTDFFGYKKLETEIVE